MAKLQNKKAPAPRGKVKKESEDEEIAATEQIKNETDEVKVSEITEVANKGDTEKETSSEEEDEEEEDGKEESGEKEEAIEKEDGDEETKGEDQEEKPSADDKEENTEKTPRRRRGRGKKQKTGEKGPKPSENGKPEEKKKVLAGLIFMCNKGTKEDCFKYKVFGLPETKKETVEKITPGMKLFLFDIDERSLHGVYEASSKGGENLHPNAFKSSKKAFPAQVRFRIKKEGTPLSEDSFKPAIKENYYGRSRFNIELSAEQVKSLEQLFHPVGNKAKKNAGNTQKAAPPSKAVKKFQRTAPAPSYLRRNNERPYYSAGYASSRLPAYGVDPGYISTDPYLTRAHFPEVSSDPFHGLGGDVLDPLYRQRAPAYSDALLRQAGKRPLDDLYLDDRYPLPMSKRVHVQDELLYRSPQHQRLGPYADRYYAGLAPY